SSDDLRDFFKLLKAANATNAKYLETEAFSRTIAQAGTNSIPPHPKPHPALHVLTHEEVLRVSRREMQYLFQRGHILIKGRFISAQEQRWNEDNISTIGDMDQLREMH
ncbi:hypothetical protein V5O48_019700, partial [Marasmius crinis-equi]